MDSCFRRNDDGGVEAASREQWEFPLSLWERVGVRGRIQSPCPCKPGLRNPRRDVLLAVVGLCAGGKSGRMDSCFRRNDDGCGASPVSATLSVTSCWPWLVCALGGKSGRMDSCFRRNDDGGGNDDGGVEATSREQWEFPLSLWEKAGW